MTLHDLTSVLEDTVALHAVAQRAGITLAAARTVFAALADLPAVQVVRMTKTAQLATIREANRKTRIGR